MQVTEVWLDEMTTYITPYERFRNHLDAVYTNHYSRGLRNRRAILLATTSLKAVNINSEVMR